MSNIQASLLLPQLERIDERLRRREEICKRYESELENFEGVELLKVVQESKSARHLFTILVDADKRDRILQKFQDKEIGVAVNFRAVHLLDYYKSKYDFKRGDFPHAESMGDRTITLPLYPKLTDEEVEYVIQTVKEVISS